MPERCDRCGTWRIGPPISVGHLTLWPIEHLLVTHERVGQRVLWCAMQKEPVAIVVREATRTRAIGPDGAPVALDRLRERLPGLDAALASA